MLAVVDTESHGSNMGFVGESEDRPFGENGRRHGTLVSPTEPDSPFRDKSRSPRRRSKSVTCIRQEDHESWKVFNEQAVRPGVHTNLGGFSFLANNMS